MASSLVHGKLNRNSMVFRQDFCRFIVVDGFGKIARNCLVGVFIMYTLLLAPENPQQQASICERHNSVEACQVW